MNDIVKTSSPISVRSSQQWSLLDEKALSQWTKKLAPCLPDSMIIALEGHLGAGKTTFSRHLLQALGVNGKIKSPSYSLVESYETPNCLAWHFDFYRLHDAQEWEDAGFRDIFSAKGLKLVEWSKKAQALMPPPDWIVSLSITDDPERALQVESISPLGDHVLHSFLAL